MGQCLSLDQEELKARARSDAIDRKLQTWAKKEQNVIKILLLGAAEGGKSTLVKQMKIIHNDGFSEDELVSFKAHAQTVLTCTSCLDKRHSMIPHMYSALKALWQDRGVRSAVSRGYEYELNDSAIYYFENMDRICHPNFIPNPKDVLRARVRTTGVIETCFKIEGVIIRMFDVGGQRSERRKWIGCFDNVVAVLFVVALSAYDMCLYEDPDVNRLQESLNLFRAICNNRFFREACMILFLNKLDLFTDKIRYSGRHLRLFFPDYEGPDKDVNSAAHFIQNDFMLQNHIPNKVIYPHFTTATDTSNIQVVFQVVMDSVLRENLRKASIL